MTKFFLMAFSAITFSVFSQHQCASAIETNKQLDKNPELKAAYLEYENALQVLNANTNSEERASMNNQKKIIPVVIHIMHDYDANNITDAQVQSAMAQLNEDFLFTASDTTQIVSAFKTIAGNMNVEFKLARKDPNGNCTTGITRWATKETFTAGESIKEIVKWDPAKYLNVWVVKTIANGAAGYSFIPGTAPGIYPDGNAGIIIRNDYFGTTGTANPGTYTARSFSHEVGHYLGLHHPWGPSNQPGVQSNCSIDDYVNDTPKCLGLLSNCNTSFQSCGSLDNVQNIMSYAGCPIMFTKGQVQRVQNYLNTHNYGVAKRSGLWKTGNLIATGTNDGYVANECEPVSDFYSKSRITCVGSPIEFKTYAHGASVINHEWTFTGANTKTSTDDNPSVSFNQAGTYSVSLKVSNAQGNDVETKTAYFKVLENSQASTPVEEGFENFVYDNINNANSWHREAPNASSRWTINSTSYSGAKSLKARTSSFHSSQETSIVSPVFDFSNVSSTPYLYFKYAYKEIDDASDKLKVYASDNCGDTWSSRKTLSGSKLETATGNNSPNWIPTSDQWKEIKISLLPLKGDPNAMIKITLQGMGGAFAYIDDIYVSEYAIGVEEQDILGQNISIYPNPVGKGISKIDFHSKEAGMLNFSIKDALGRTIHQEISKIDEGEQTREIPQGLDAGMYWVEMSIGAQRLTKKFVVQ
ncbi:MAG: M43 family zinc metalloprotease [Flavobacteriales bacterium]|jgi:PKD repeat protein|nr:M43 family zinc metalloprotease [Flavobacteriales bacterium]